MAVISLATMVKVSLNFAPRLQNEGVVEIPGVAGEHGADLFLDHWLLAWCEKDVGQLARVLFLNTRKSKRELTTWKNRFVRWCPMGSSP